MTTIKLEGVFKAIETFICCVIPTVYKPAIRLKERSGTKIAVAVPPITWAAS